MSALIHASAQIDAIPPLWRIVTKFGYFFGLAAVIGGAWTHWLVVKPALSQANAADAAVLRRRSATIAGLGALVIALVAYPQLAGRVARAGDGMPYADAVAPSAVWAFLTKPAKTGEWIPTGILAMIQNSLVIVIAIMLVPLLFGLWRKRADILIAIAAPLAVAISLIGSIPTKALTLDGWLGKILIQGHIIGGSLWVGGLMALALLARARRQLSPQAGPVWARIWARFGVLALVSVGMVLISGIWLTWKEVGAWEQFLTTPFGRFLLVKVLLVAGLIAAGAYNQLVLMPKIAQALRRGDATSVFAYTLKHFPKVVVTEAVLGVAVLAIVPFLNGGARSQAVGREVEPPVIDASLLTLGLVMLATMIASFYGTAKASQSLGARSYNESEATA